MKIKICFNFKIAFLLVIISLLISLCSCAETSNIEIISEGNSEYSLVYPYTSNINKDIEYKTVCEKTAETIKTLSGLNMNIISEKDSSQADSDAHEIVIGITNKFAYTKAEKEELAHTGYIIKTEGNRVFVMGNNIASCQAGVDFLIEYFFDEESKSMSIPTGYKTISHIPLEDVPPSVITIAQFSYGPTVFAIGDEYQIVYHTNTKGLAWVEIDGKSYFDEYEGIIRSESIHHKISIPMEILDNAKKYSIHFAPVYEKTAYSPERGAEIQQEYTFRPIDTSDGLQIYSVADSHSNTVNCCKTAKYYANKLDLLVLCGDINSESTSTERLYDIAIIAHKITGGTIPVVYARGNHENRGQAAELINDHVGSDNGTLYFTFRIGNLWGVVLDCGEDNPDSHEQYGGMVSFDTFRKAQTAFLEEVVSNANDEYNAPGVEHRIAICHIPFPARENYAPAPEIFHQWTALLSKMNLDFMLSGHQHKTYVCKAETISKEQNFPVVVGSTSNIKINDSETNNEYIGAAVEIIDGNITVSFTNVELGVEFTETWKKK